MKNNLLNLENIENLDANQVYELSMKHVEQFSPEELLEFIDENITKLDFILDGYHEANILNPSDALAHVTISKSLQTFCLIEHWIRTHVMEESTEDNLDNELEQDDEL